MMERSGKLVPVKDQGKGRPRQETAFICKVCGKESKVTNTIDHIESNHIEGIALTCNFCNHDYGSRKSLRLIPFVNLEMYTLKKSPKGTFLEPFQYRCIVKSPVKSSKTYQELIRGLMVNYKC